MGTVVMWRRGYRSKSDQYFSSGRTNAGYQKWYIVGEEKNRSLGKIGGLSKEKEKKRRQGKEWDAEAKRSKCTSVLRLLKMYSNTTSV